MSMLLLFHTKQSKTLLLLSCNGISIEPGSSSLAIPIEAHDVSEHFGMNDVKRLADIDLHKVRSLFSLLNKCLPPVFQILRCPLTLTCKEDFCRGVQINHKVGSRIKVSQTPPMHSFR